MFCIVYITSGKTNSYRYLWDLTVGAVSTPLYNHVSDHGVNSPST